MLRERKKERLTKLFRTEHELNDRSIVIGIDDLHRRVLAPELLDGPPEHRVVNPRQRIELPNAPAARSIATFRVLGNRQVDRETAHGQNPRDDQIHGALRDQFLHASKQGANRRSTIRTIKWGSTDRSTMDRAERYLNPGRNGFDDGGDDRVRLLYVLPGEERGVVVVSPELSDDEEGFTEESLTIYNPVANEQNKTKLS